MGPQKGHAALSPLMCWLRPSALPQPPDSLFTPRPGEAASGRLPRFGTKPQSPASPGRGAEPPYAPPELPVWVLGHREPLELLASRLQGVPGRGPSQRGSPRQSFGEVRGAPHRRRPLLSCVTASPAPGLPVLTRGWGRGWPRPRIPIGTGTRPPVPLGRDGARQGGGRSPPPSHGCCHHRGTRAGPGVLGEAQHPSPGRLWGQPG